MTNLWWENKSIVQFLEHYRAMSQRERNLTQATIHIVFATVISAFIVLPLMKSGTALRTQSNETETNLARMETHLQRLRSSPLIDLNESVRDDLNRVKSQLETMEERIRGVTQNLVSAGSMPEVLEKMLTEESNLKLVSLKNNPSENVAKDSEEFRKVSLYRHAVRVELISDYPSIISYLKRLDDLPWKLYWQTLKYNVEEYPEGRLQIEIYTLSAREEILSE
ncbi:MAG: hypothetical protein P1U57_00740 [Oleibacter sp.]|nr:hypothetical protein [Thalassolituus sp.]